MMARRPRSLEVPGVTHGQTPIPMGARVGSMIFTSGIAGKDPATDTLPPDAASQARFAFENLRTLVENGGGRLEDIGHLTVFVKDNSVREFINTHWLRLFPDPQDRPARHTLVHDLPGGMWLQLEAIAVVQEAP